MRLSGEPTPPLVESRFAVNVPLVSAARSARIALATYSSGVLTFCIDPPLLRKRSELKIVFSTARIWPFGLLFSHANMH